MALLDDGLLLDHTFRRRLSLISAPAGYGKTTLVTEWIQEHLQAGAWQAAGANEPASGQETRPQVTWLTLEAGDNDLARFFHYLAAALQKADENVDHSFLPGNLSSTFPAPASLMTALINDLARGNHPILLVLDDYHLIENSGIHDAISFLLRHQPPRLHLVMTSRGEPVELPLAHLGARQQMMALDQTDLRFTPAETAAFLSEKRGITLSESDVSVLAERTEGWVTGVQLAALALQGGPLPSAPPGSHHFLQAFSGDQRYLAEYLAEEVLANLPERTQHFLQHTSVLERLCAPLCEAVTGEARSNQMLQQVEDEGLFLTPLDSRRHWYRYHHLFAAFLRARLRRGYSDLVPHIHRRASDWFQENDLPHEAVHHALATGDAAYALEVIDRYDDWLLRQGELTTLIDWLEPIPRSQLFTRPVLSLALGWALLIQGRFDEASAVADAVEPHLGAEHEGQRLALRAGIARRQRQMATARRFAREAVAHREKHDDDSGSVALLYLAELMLGEGQMQEAQRLANEALRFYRSQNQPYMETQALYYLINVRITTGQLHEATALCGEAFNVMERHGLPYRVGGFHGRMGLIHWERGELDEAASYLQEGVEIARRGKHVPFFVGNALWLARTWQAQEKGEQAKTLIEEALAMAASWPRHLAQIRRWQAGAALRVGHTAAAARWVGEQGLAADDELDYYAADGYFILARLLALQGRMGQARPLLRRLQALAEHVGACSLQIQSLLYLADLYAVQSKTAIATKTVEHALTLGSPGGYVQRFVEAGPAVAHLLRRISDRHAHSGEPPFSRSYLQRVLQACGQDAVERARPAPTTTEHESLTPREKEIVQLLGRGLSNPQIAEQLHISVGTVRWHVKNVYKKLSVNNRVQATRRAQALGLVPQGQNPP